MRIDPWQATRANVIPGFYGQGIAPEAVIVRSSASPLLEAN